ncbi:MAG: hypothetical protein ACI9CD_000501 [Candidatus Deianiraeaceae bacterium]|jgi:hypothetical protein
MNRSYQVYLQNKYASFIKKVIVFSTIFLLLVVTLHFVEKYFANKNRNAEEDIRKVERSSSKNSSLNANRDAVSRAYLKLTALRRENKSHGRQYIIEYLTKISAKYNLSNFVIESISQKESIVNTMYADLKTMNAVLYEVDITFNSIVTKQMESFINDVRKNINGAVVLQQVHSRRIMQDIDADLLESINNGQRVSMLGNRLILHWFFIK